MLFQFQKLLLQNLLTNSAQSLCFLFFQKCLKKILKVKFSDFLAKNDILTSSQFDFRENNSSELAITSFYDKLLNNLNENKITCSIFLDLRKAFDRVDRKILLKKLYHYGFRGTIFRYLNSYRAVRQICKKIDGKISSPRLVEYGVPQGSILGPLFFLLYVNDLPHATNFETTLFADDTNLHLCDSNITTLRSRIKSETVKINDWMSYNKLTVNYKKSCFIVSKWYLHNCNFDIFTNHNQNEKKTST